MLPQSFTVRVGPFLAGKAIERLYMHNRSNGEISGYRKATPLARLRPVHSAAA